MGGKKILKFNNDHDFLTSKLSAGFHGQWLGLGPRGHGWGSKPKNQIQNLKFAVAFVLRKFLTRDILRRVFEQVTMKVISNVIILTILILGGEALQCYNCIADPNDDYDIPDECNSTTTKNYTTCESDQLCATVDVTVTDIEIETNHTTKMHFCGNYLEAEVLKELSCFTGKEWSELFDEFLNTFLEAIGYGGDRKKRDAGDDDGDDEAPKTKSECSFYTCNTDLCNTAGQATQISLLVATLVSLIQLL